MSICFLPELHFWSSVLPAASSLQLPRNLGWPGVPDCPIHPRHYPNRTFPKDNSSDISPILLISNPVRKLNLYIDFKLVVVRVSCGRVMLCEVWLRSGFSVIIRKCAPFFKPRILSPMQLLFKQHSFYLSRLEIQLLSSHLGNNSFIEPVSNLQRILSSIQLLLSNELLRQFSFHFSEIIFINPAST